MNIPFVRSLEAAVAYRYEEFDNKDQFGDADIGHPEGTTVQQQRRRSRLAALSADSGHHPSRLLW